MATARTDPIEISNAVQDYTKAIWSIAQRDDGPVSTSALADRLGVSPASASAMVKRLESLGLASREPYHGVRLTRAGERVALEVLRHHRLLELYLAEALGMPWDRVHEEAEKMEHAISPSRVGMGSPCGSCVGLPSFAAISSDSSGEIACSSFSASS